MNGWKMAFTACALFLVLSNLFWLQTIGSKVEVQTDSEKHAYQLRETAEEALDIMPLIGRAMTRTTLLSIAENNYRDNYFVDGDDIYIGWLKFTISAGRIAKVEGLSVQEKAALSAKGEEN